MKKMSLWAMLFAVASVAGCNNCEKMTDAICTDLGAEDCATWKAIGGPEQAVPGGRKVNKACGLITGNAAAYKGVVKAARGLVLADQMKKATDNAKRLEIAGKMKTLATE